MKDVGRELDEDPLEGQLHAAGRRQQDEAEPHRLEKGDEDLFPSTIIVDGFILPYLVPTEDDFYDGGSYWFITSQPDENGEPETVKESFLLLPPPRAPPPHFP